MVRLPRIWPESRLKGARPIRALISRRESRPSSGTSAIKQAVVAGPMIEVIAGAQEEGLRVVGCRHEESAAFMASAWGYALRKPGVVVTGSGPGMTNAVTPMYAATEGGMPLEVLGGSTHAAMRGWGGFQEGDQLAFAAVYVQEAEGVRVSLVDGPYRSGGKAGLGGKNRIRRVSRPPDARRTSAYGVLELCLGGQRESEPSQRGHDLVPGACPRSIPRTPVPEASRPAMERAAILPGGAWLLRRNGKISREDPAAQPDPRPLARFELR